MYLDYFSLNRHPFRITPDPSLFFPGGQDGRGVILNALIYAINSGEGILKVVGEVGSGKTMLCRMLEEELPDSVEIVYIANPSLSAREILYAIAIELKLEVNSSTERLKVLHLIQDYLLKKHSQGGAVVVFIEEAQSMPLETLEEIRLLSNLETHQNKLMQIVLFGQPELDKILAQKNIRQLRERITHSFSLVPLSAEATSEYIRYRLNVAGSPWKQLFSSRAEKMIAKASSGLTRRVNILADKSLLAAYADSPSRQPPQDGNESLVLPRHVKAAIKDSNYKNSSLSPWLFGSLSFALLVMLSVFILFREFWPVSDPATSLVAGSQAEAATVQLVSNNALQNEPRLEVNSIGDGVTTETVADSVEGLIIREPAVLEEEPVVANLNDQATSELPGEVAEEIELQIQPGLVAQTIPLEIDISESEEEVVEALPAENVAIQNQELSEAQVRTLPEESIGNSTLESLQPSQEAVASVDAEVPATNSARDEIVSAQPAPAAIDREELPVIVLLKSQPVEDELPVSPVTIVPSGLAESRMQPTAEWLRTLSSKSGYSLVMFSVPSTNPRGLEEYLQFLQLVSLLDETYICFMPISSPTSGRWQVMHKEFQGVTPARNFINKLPVYVQQYDPYVSNLGQIECSYPVETGR
ncbi:MAG: MSHA biogenesis protein MshM [Pseudohongiellaceae bacterium]|jgi:MSHA biogenesis protein MshM